MQVRTGIFFGSLILLAGCAVPPPAPRVAVAPAAAEHGTILAIHRVAPEDAQAARVLLQGLDDQAGAQAQRVEYIVRVQGGATIAIVQSGLDGLRPGDRVGILPATAGTEPRLRPIGG
ncbi:MAG TPA: hypothetical protein VGG99_01690 [Acetobacteraceae bacterium]|jgi:hypothetical protein